MQNFLYHYKATVSKLMYDGDTWTVDIDLGFGTILKGQKLRFFGINTPEVKGPQRAEGKEVRNWCRINFPPGTEIVLQTVPNRGGEDSKGKYGRWLAIVWTQDGRNINQFMVDTGKAEPATY